MYNLFNQNITVLKKVLTPDNTGGDTISFQTAQSTWRARVTSAVKYYKASETSMQYSRKLKIIGSSDFSINERDRIVFQNTTWEISAVAIVPASDSLPEHIRAVALAISFDGGSQS